jgi:hypothetical protein
MASKAVAKAVGGVIPVSQVRLYPSAPERPHQWLAITIALGHTYRATADLIPEESLTLCMLFIYSNLPYTD